ncbi:MAG: tetratricopeptide repeat protein, partial [Acidobacteria bacterium]|nr:tetratricopeptide repeat protein [Acidobacteriota bacterium]
ERYNQAGMEAYQQANYAEAEKQWSSALQEAEKFGPEDPRLATSLNNLAALYLAQGKYGETEPLLQRALAIVEKALGPEHPEVATSLENYADLLRKMGREDEAAKMEARAQAIRAKNAQGSNQ